MKMADRFILIAALMALLCVPALGVRAQFGSSALGDDGPATALGGSTDGLGNGVGVVPSGGVEGCPDPSTFGVAGSVITYFCANDIDGDGTNNSAWVDSAEIGNGVTTWEDKGSIGDSLERAGACGTVVEDCLGEGIWCVRANGVSNACDSTLPAAGGPYNHLHDGSAHSCYFAQRPTDSGALFSTAKVSVNAGSWASWSSDELNHRVYDGAGGTPVNRTTTGTAYDLDVFNFVGWSSDYSATPDIQYWANGSDNVTTNFSSDPTSIGNHSFLFRLFIRVDTALAAVDMFALICFDAAHDFDDRAAVQAGFEDHLGVTFGS